MAGADDDELGPVLRALGDPSRRLLLDRLAARDGQTLVALTASLPDLTRHGVMKHLGVLEAAGLVTTVKVGRERHHYLNPVPIRLVHDRWISRFTEPTAAALSRLKTLLEEPMTTAPPDHVFVVHVKAPPEAVWQAFTSNELVGRWCHDVQFDDDTRWGVGVEVIERTPDGRAVATLTVLEAERPTRISVRIQSHVFAEQEGDPPYVQTWDIEEQGNGTTRVTVTASGFETENATYQMIAGGLRWLLDNLKTLLETGASLTGA